MKLDITKSKTADTKYCDWSQVSKQDLLVSSTQHIGDIQRGFMFFIRKMTERSLMHDKSKITDIDGFHEDFKTGFKKQSGGKNIRKSSVTISVIQNVSPKT